MSELVESLLKCTVRDKSIFLPTEPLSNYPMVKKALLNAGGKYHRSAFTFSSDAQIVIDKLTSGVSINIKKDFQFFETGDSLADRLVMLADINESDLILEPSAGRGSIVRAVSRVLPKAMVNCVELMKENYDLLEKNRNAFLIGTDFMNLLDCRGDDPMYTKIIANPPLFKKSGYPSYP